MKKLKIFLAILFFLCIFFNNLELIGQNAPYNNQKNAPPKKTSEEKLVEELEILISEIKIMNGQNVDSKLEKKIESLAEEIYLRKYKITDDIMRWGQWIILVLLGAFPIILWILGYLFRQNLNQKINVIKEKSKETIDAIDAKIMESDKMIKILNEKIKATETDVIKMIKSSQADTYYQIATASINKKRFDHALEFLLELFSSNYRLRDVCYHIGICYKNLNDYPRALEFLEKAKVEAEKEGKDSLTARIQGEIDEIKKKL